MVDIERCGICGTDVAAYRSGQPYTPFLHGHEWTGTVAEVGKDAWSVRAGDRVVLGSPRPCGKSALCRAGVAGQSAGLMDLRGPGGVPPPVHGGYAPRIAVDVRRLVPLPDEVPTEFAALVEPAAVAMHGVRRTPIRIGEPVVVQGCGPIGLLALQLATAAGAGTVIAVEPDPARRERARRLGADAVEPGAEAIDVVGERTGGLGAGVVIECAGSAAALDAAVRLCRPGGWVTMVGVASTPVTIEPSLWLVREVTVTASLAHAWSDFEAVFALAGSGRLQFEPLISTTVPLSELADAFARLADGRDDLCKVLVDPRDV